MSYLRILAALILILTVQSCSESGGGSAESASRIELEPAPEPNGDSLYTFVQDQVDFGPRVPNTAAHRNAAQWFVKKFESFGARVQVQEFTDQVYDGTKVELKNIIASFNPDVKKRILLAAHWDTRPFADKDAEDKMAPLDGANDGGSGVAVLLEVARQIAIKSPSVGVDMILFDGEDWGEHAEESGSRNPRDYGKDSWYCLGSQHWSKNKHKANYTAYYGILLDMVGAEDATFYYDGVSQQNAGRILTRTWNIAHQLGYQDLFIKELGLGNGIVDDHKYVNEIARIPMIDILDYRKEDDQFGPYHHTQQDDMDIISKETLSAVADVVLTVIYNE